MILRALFWIAVVAMLMPREPNLGLGRPDAGLVSLPQSVIRIAQTQKSCDADDAGCAAEGFIGMVQDAALKRLAEVKVEIAESQRERAAAARN
jgi:hypothetical protein